MPSASADRELRFAIRDAIHRVMDAAMVGGAWPHNLDTIERALTEGLSTIQHLRQDPHSLQALDELKTAVSNGDVDVVVALLDKGLKPAPAMPEHVQVFSGAAQMEDPRMLQELQARGWGVPEHPLAAHEFLRAVTTEAAHFSAAGCQAVIQALLERCKPGESPVKSFAQHMLNTGQFEMLDALGDHVPQGVLVFTAAELPDNDRLKALIDRGVQLQNDGSVTRGFHDLLARVGAAQDGVEEATASKRLALLLSTSIKDGTKPSFDQMLQFTVLHSSREFADKLSDAACEFLAREVRQRFDREDPLVASFTARMVSGGRTGALDALGDHVQRKELVFEGGPGGRDADRLAAMTAHGVRWANLQAAGQSMAQALRALEGSKAPNTDKAYQHLCTALSMDVADGTKPSLPQLLRTTMLGDQWKQLAKFPDEQLRGLGKLGLFDQFDNDSLVHTCVAAREHGLLKRMLECGADVTVLDAGKGTLAHRLAAELAWNTNRQSDLRTLAVLIEAGVDLGVRDSRGRTLKDYARQANRPDVIEVIQAQEARLGIAEEEAPSQRTRLKAGSR